MNRLITSLLSALTFVSSHVGSCGQSVKYEFTGGSLVPTVSGLPTGVTATNFSLGTFPLAALTDNGGDGNSLRLSRGDIGTSSSLALAGPCLSFSINIPAGTALNLTSLSIDYTSGGVVGAEYMNSRVFSNIDGFDDLTGDTIGTLGRTANGANAGSMAVSLATPGSNPTRGANVNNGEFDSLTNRTITFYLPFIRDSQTTATDYVDIDNVTLAFTSATPPPAGIIAITASPVSSFEASLAWSETLSDETGFVIERSVTGSEIWKTVITTAADVHHVRDLTVSPGVDHIYRISASLPAGNASPSLVSNSVSIPAVTSRTQLAVMPIGDSITEGAGGIGGYRSPLYVSLTASGMQINYVGTRTNGTSQALIDAGEINHEGHGSYATTLLTGNLDGLLNPVALPYGTPPNTNEGGYWLTGTGTRPAVYPDVFLLMIGTNDLGMFQRTPAQVEGYYDQLLTKIVTLRPGALVICSTVPPYTGADYVGTNPVKDYSQREANNQAFNQILQGLVATYQAEGHRVRISDVRQKITPANQATLIGGDGVHPTGAGYNAIAAAWFDAMKQLPLMECWRLLHFGSAAAGGQAADSADPDADGCPNIMEYALGTDPLVSQSSPLQVAGMTEAGGTYLAATFPRRKSADLQYIVEVSSDLMSWDADTQQSGAPISLNENFEQVTFRDRQATSSPEKRFIRVRVLHP